MSVIVGIALLSVGSVLGVAESNFLTFYLLAVALAGLPLAHWIRMRLKNPKADRLSEDEKPDISWEKQRGLQKVHELASGEALAPVGKERLVFKNLTAQPMPPSFFGSWRRRAPESPPLCGKGLT